MPDARTLWTAGSAPPPHLDPEEIAARAGRLRRQVHLSLAMELVAGVAMIAFFTASAALPGWSGLPPISRLGAALIACACVFVLTYLVLRGAPEEPPPTASTLVTYRAAIERRHALLASVVRWYLAPFWPGVALFLLGIGLDRAGAPGAAPTLALVTAVVVAVNVAIAWANHRAARRLARELALLPVPGDGPDA